MKLRPVLSTFAFVTLVALAVGCSGDSSGSKVAELAPPNTPVFVEGVVRPTGDLKSNTDAIATQVAGIGNLGDYVVSQLESSAQEDGESFDYAKEVEPWLGEHGGVFFERLEGSDFSGAGVIVESTDPSAAQKFIETQVKASDDPYRSASYQGIEYELGGSDGNALGVVGDFLVVAEGEKVFKKVVDASRGNSLASQDTFADAISAAADDSLADVYVDVGELIDQSGGEIDPQARQILGNAGIDPSEATAVASVVPGSEQITVEFSSDLGGEEAPSGDISNLIEVLPSNAVVAFGISDFGAQLEDAIDSLDEEGIPDAVPPGQLKKGLKEIGIDVDAVVGSLQDAVIYAIGDAKGLLSGALVMTTDDTQAVDAIAGLGPVLEGIGIDGVGVFDGTFDGVYIRNPDLGSKPVVAVTKDGRISIGYGYPATVNPLFIDRGKDVLLAELPSYKAAVAALGDTPINGFVEGATAFSLADSLIPASNGDFEEAKKYLKHIRFLALGSATQGERATAKLIVGLN